MSALLKPAVFPACYELLRAIVPAFRSLPDADEIEFRAVKFAHYADCDGEVIRISTSKHGHLSTLLETLAHEMVHVLQHHRGIPIGHGPEFKRIAKQVCRICGFDHKSF